MGTGGGGGLLGGALGISIQTPVCDSDSCHLIRRTSRKEVRDKAGATLYRSANTSGHEEAAAQAIAELLAYLDPDVKLGNNPS